MENTSTSRRSILKSGAALTSLGVVGSFAGCLGGGDGDDSDDSGSSGRIDRVPAGAEFVIHVDAAGMLDDDTITERANEFIQNQQQMEGGPSTLEDVFAQADEQAGFEVSAVNEMLAYGSSSEEAFGAIVWGGWDQDTFTSVLTENGLSEGSYGGKTTYTQDSEFGDDTWVGVLSGSAYAMGTEAEVKAMIDTWTGSSDSVSGDVRDGFTAAQGGYMQFAFDVPEEMVPEGGSSSQIDTSVFEDIDYGYGSVTDASNGREMHVSMEMANSDSAEGLKGILNLGLGMAQQQLTQQAEESQVEDEQIQQLQDALDNVEIEQSGSTVTVTNEDGVDFALIGLAVAASFLLGLGEGPGGTGRTAPRANFSFDYDASSSELTITHTSGDTLDPSSLYIRGQGVQTGNWAALGGESLSGGVSAGNSLTLSNVSSSYEVLVVWQDDAAAATLAESTGPDA